MIIEKLVPVRAMLGTDWDNIDKGLWLTGTSDMGVPFENSISRQIITYLLNEKLSLSNYTNQFKIFYFDVVSYIDFGLIIPAQGVSILDQEDMLVLQLSVHIDGPRFAKVNKHEALRMIAQLMLDSIPKYLFDRTDFDGHKFYDDILPIVQPIADGTRTFQEEEFPM